MSLLTIECTCVDGTECETFIVSLSSTGVNTNRIWQMETFMKDLEACGADLTVKECHRLMDKVEHDTKGGYTPLQSAFASALACSAFVFLLGGGVPEMAPERVRPARHCGPEKSFWFSSVSSCDCAAEKQKKGPASRLASQRQTPSWRLFQKCGG